jgi:hypothetical protein
MMEQGFLKEPFAIHSAGTPHYGGAAFRVRAGRLR